MRVLALVLLSAAAVGLAACGDDSSGSDSDTLTVYSGRAGGLIGPLIDQYEQERGVDLEVRFGDTAELAATIREEGPNSPADLFIAQDAGALGALQDAGAFTELPADVVEPVDARFRSQEDVWVGASARARVVAYNEGQVEEEQLPPSVVGFTDPRWKGRVGWAPRNASFQAFVTAMREVLGEDRTRAWLEGMLDNVVVPFDNNVAIRDAVARGEIDVGLINHYYVAQAVAEEGEDYPVAVFYPPGGDPGSLVNVAGAGVLASSEKQEMALDFIRYMLSETGQTYFVEQTKEYPVVEGIEPPPGVPPLASIEQPDVDLSDLDDLQGTLELLRDTGAL